MDINIKNFKSLEDASFVFKPNTLLIGGNGHGKSSVFKAINFLKEYFSNKTSDLFLEDFQLYVNSSYKTSKYFNLINSGKFKNKVLSFEFPYLNGVMHLFFEQGISNSSVKLKKFEYRDVPNIYEMESPSFLSLEIDSNRKIKISLNRDVDSLFTLLEKAFSSFNSFQKNDEDFIKLNSSKKKKLTKKISHKKWMIKYIKDNCLNKFPYELQQFLSNNSFTATKNTARINYEKSNKKLDDNYIDSVDYRYFLFDVDKESINEHAEYVTLDIIQNKFKAEIIKILHPIDEFAKENKFSNNDQRSLLETFRYNNLRNYRKNIESAFDKIKKEFLDDEGLGGIIITPEYEFIINFCDHFLFKPIFNHRENLNNKLASIIHIPIPRQIYLEDFSESTGENLMKKFINLRQILYETLIISRHDSKILPEFENLLPKLDQDVINLKLDTNKLQNPNFWENPIYYKADNIKLKNGM